MLSGGDSAALGRAAQQAASGDMSALSAMLSQVLSSPQGAELVQRLENASSNAKVSCLILRDGQLTLALQTRYVFAGIPPELDMRDIDGIRRWFTASLTGMGGLLDILQESPALTGAEK